MIEIGRKLLIVVLISALIWGQVATSIGTVWAQPTALGVSPRQNFQQFVGFADRLRAQIDRSQFELEPLVDRLDRDPERIFAFVRDEIQFEAYQWALRGPRATLEGRAGNAADQALLLGALLSLAGVENIEVMHGELEPASADILFQQMFRARRPAGANILSSGKSKEFAEILGLAESDADAMLLANRAANAAFLDAIGLNARKMAGPLFEALLATARETMTQPLAGADHLMPAISEHIWLRVDLGDGRPVALDPAFDEAEPGIEYGSPARTLPWEERGALAPETTIEIVVDRVEGGALKSETILSHAEALSSLTDGAVTFSLLPEKFEPLAAGATPGRPGALARSIADSNAFLPILSTGETQVVGRPFDRHGRPRLIEGGGLVPLKRAEAVGGLFSTVTNRVNEELGPESDFAGLEVRITTQVAGEVLQALSAPLIRAQTQAARLANMAVTLPDWTPERTARSAIISGSLDFSTHRPHPARVLYDSLDRFVRNAKALESGDLEKATGDLSLPIARLWSAMSRAVAARAPVRAGEIRIYEASPRVALHLRGLRDTNDGLNVTTSLDVLENAWRIAHRSSTPDANLAARRLALELGVADTLIEAVLAGADAFVDNAYLAMQSDLRSGAEVAALPAAAAARMLDHSALSDDARALIEADMRDGHFALITTPPSAEDVIRHWWRYDPLTGAILGKADTGRGQALWEYVNAKGIAVGTVIGISIGYAACSYRSENEERFRECMGTAIRTEVVLAAALVAMALLIPTASVWAVLGGMFALGASTYAYGTSTGNEQLADVGFAFMAEAVGTGVVGDVFSVVSRPAAEFIQRVRRAAGGPNMPRLAFAGAGAADDAIFGAPTFFSRGYNPHARAHAAADALEDIAADGERILPELLEEQRRFADDDLVRRWRSGQPFEDIVEERLLQNMGDEIGEITDAAGNSVDNFDSVVRGYIGNTNKGIDTLGLRDGDLYIIESKYSDDLFSGARLDTRPRSTYGNAAQLSPRWIRETSERLIEGVGGMDRLRALYGGLADGMDDAALSTRFRSDIADAIENGRIMVIAPEGSGDVIRRLDEYPARIRNNPDLVPQLDETRHVYTIDVPTR